MADGTIVDPIYIGVVAGASTTPPATGGSLASTGMSVWVIAVSGILALSGGTAAMFKLAYRRARLDFSK